MRRKASNRLLAALLFVAALLLPLGLAAAEEGGLLGDLFRELLGEGTQETVPGACARTGRCNGACRRTATSACRSAARRWSSPSRRWSRRRAGGGQRLRLAAGARRARRSRAIRSSSSSSATSRCRRACSSRWAPACWSTRRHRRHQLPRHPRRRRRSRSRPSDGREFESKMLLKDERIDLAVLKIEAPRAVPGRSPIGDSDALEVGDLVLAIGDPFGVGQTMTSGIVSALARSHIGISDFGFFIQTDAAINPGNSGGALINMNGELVGINTAIYSRSGGSIGIGFAIPSNMVRAVVASAKSGSDYFERPYVGATFEAVTAQIAEALGLDRPARRAGLRRRRRTARRPRPG